MSEDLHLSPALSVPNGFWLVCQIENSTAQSKSYQKRHVSRDTPTQANLPRQDEATEPNDCLTPSISSTDVRGDTVISSRG